MKTTGWCSDVLTEPDSIEESSDKGGIKVIRLLFIMWKIFKKIQVFGNTSYKPMHTIQFSIL